MGDSNEEYARRVNELCLPAYKGTAQAIFDLLHEETASGPETFALVRWGIDGLTALLESRPEWTFRAHKWQRRRDSSNLNRGQIALIERSAKRSAEELSADELAVTVRGLRDMINDPMYELVPKHQRLDQARVRVLFALKAHKFWLFPCS